jgi:hypothetical protein
MDYQTRTCEYTIAPANRNKNISPPGMDVRLAVTEKFMEENLVEENGAFIYSGPLYEKYQAYCFFHRRLPLCVTAFQEVLRRKFPTAVKTRKRAGSDNRRMWMNIRMTQAIALPEIENAEGKHVSCQ